MNRSQAARPSQCACKNAFHGVRRARSGAGFDPVVVQNPLDRVPGDVGAEIRERATDARVPPRWILDRHPHHEVGHLAWRYRPASTSVGAAVVLPGNQPPVPAENRVRRDDAGDLRQNPPAEFLASHRESAALGVGQAKWTWAKLLPEDPILLLSVSNSLSGRHWELDQVPAVGDPTDIVQLGSGAMQRCLNLGFSERIGNSRRTGSCRWASCGPVTIRATTPLSLVA